MRRHGKTALVELFTLAAGFDSRGRFVSIEVWTIFGAEPSKGTKKKPLELDPGDRIYPSEARAEAARARLPGKGEGFFVCRHIEKLDRVPLTVRWSK